MTFKKINFMAMMAEFLGTFGFVYAILASMNGAFVGISTTVVASLALGLAVAMIGVISGAHVNPAVTIGAYFSKKIDLGNAMVYILVQFSGALLAWVVLSGFISSDIAQFSAADNTWSVFWAEVLGTAFLGFAIAASIYHKYEGVAASVVVALGLFMGIGFASIASNGLINPAVAAVTGSFSLSYIFGPILGAVLGFKVFALSLTTKGKL